MKGNFDRCFELLLKDEGGYVNDPVDPGGETNMGISKKAYPSEDIRGMTKDRAKMIYKRDYWTPIKGDDLPLGLDYTVFDAAVNSGVSRSSRWLQQTLGVSVDGKIGPITLGKVSSYNTQEIIDRFCNTRLSFLKRQSTWKHFGRGWERRVTEVKEVSLLMSSSVKPVAPQKPNKSVWEKIVEFFVILFGGKK